MKIFNNFKRFVWRLGALELQMNADLADGYRRGKKKQTKCRDFGEVKNYQIFSYESQFKNKFI